MYRIYCDGSLLYDPRVEDLEVFDKKLSLEVNKTGGFDFTIYPDHPIYNAIKRLKSTIEVYQDSHLLFRGRVLDDEFDFYNAKKVICEGDLAFFNDSIIRPFQFQGSITEFLQWIIDTHNSQVNPPQQFALGNVTVTTSTNYVNRSSIEPMSSWEAITSRLLTIGGFVMVRRSAGVNYIDYLGDSVYRSLQEIGLGENLLDLKKEIKGQDIITALIPYGARLKDDEGNETDERLTIVSVNDNEDYVFNQEAVDKYGWIFGTHTWDDVTIPQNLLTRANQELARRMDLQVAIEVNAVDLSMTDTTIDQFRFFEYVKINSPSHLPEDFMLVTKLDLDLDNPENNKLMLGLDYATFTERQLETEQAIKNTKEEYATKESVKSKVDLNYVTDIQTELNTTIETEAGAIRTEVEREYTAKSELEEYRETVSTQFENNYNSFNFTFRELIEQIETVDEETRVQFEELVRYIRFVEGNIVLGEVGNEITLQIQHDRISFLQSGAEVAYFSNNKLYVLDVEVLNSLQIGNFAYIPRANGSLDFKRVIN